MKDLLIRLEKTAAIAGVAKSVGGYLKNISGANVRRAEKKVKATPMNSNNWVQANKDLHNAKVDRNWSKVKTGVAAVGAGGAIGGINAYRNQMKEMEEFQMNEKQAALLESLEKTAQEGRQEKDCSTKTAHETLMESLEKTANQFFQQQQQAQEEEAQSPVAPPLEQEQPEEVVEEVPVEEPVVAQEPAQDGDNQLNAALAQLLAERLQGAPEQAVPQEPVLEEPVAQEPMLEEVPVEEPVDNSGEGARSVSHAPAGVNKTAEELFASLEKTAFAGKAVNAVKKFTGDVTGKNHANAKKTFNAQNTPEALKANAPKVGVSNYRTNLEKLEGNVSKTKNDMSKARKQAIGGGLAAAPVAVGAAMSSGSKETEKVASPVVEEVQKTASEQHQEDMNGLFKEAAAAIINEVIPEIKQHTDPMSRIRF